MKPVTFNSGIRFGDVNLRWGDPSYLLEPGDPGYVNTAPATSGGGSAKKKGTRTMNETPENQKVLLALAKKIRAGAASLQDTIGLHHHRDTTLNTAILKLEGDPAAAPGSNANKGSQLVYKSCEDAAKDARSALKALSDGTVKTLLTAYRDVMERIHGKKHNAGWSAAGFTDGVSVPREHDKRQSLLAAMRSYLAANAGHEASLPQPSGPPLAVTAAAALALGVTFQAAFDLVNTREAEQANCKNLRDADKRGLFDEVSGTIRELGDLIAADDPRWEAFGLNIPANPNPPEPVSAATLTAVGHRPRGAVLARRHPRHLLPPLPQDPRRGHRIPVHQTRQRPRPHLHQPHSRRDDLRLRGGRERRRRGRAKSDGDEGGGSVGNDE
jgi:hypothetical protein